MQSAKPKCLTENLFLLILTIESVGRIGAARQSLAR